MLRNRPRTVPSSKQALMADHYNQGSQSPNTKPISSFFISPRFRAFTTKGLSEADSLMSPTSTLDSKQFLSPLRTPNPKSEPKPKPFLLFDKTQNQKQPKSLESEPRGIGIALIGTLSEDPIGDGSKPRNSKVLFGSKLRVQIPQSSDFAPTKNTQDPPPPPLTHPQAFTLEEMELSEDYTCVTSHGPNPRTTHIFDNYVVESYSSALSEKSSSCSPTKNNFITFLSFCHTCSKSLEHKNDIFIYRGDKAFCSEDCRNQEMLMDGVENSGF